MFVNFKRSVAGCTLLDQKTKYRHTFRIKNIIQFNWENRKAKKKNGTNIILRMTTDRLPKVLLNYKPRGYRNIGRPIARWEDAFSWSLKQAFGLYPWSRTTTSKHFPVKHLKNVVSPNHSLGITTDTNKMAVFWVVAPCSLAEVYRRFRGACCLHHKGDETASTSETPVYFYQTALRNNPQNSHLHYWRHENLKSHCWHTSILHCHQIAYETLIQHHLLVAHSTKC
jgi:hypothetical protein